MNKRLFLIVFLTSFSVALFSLGRVVFATATPNQCSPNLNGMGTTEVEKPLSSVSINSDQPEEVLKLFQNKNEKWDIKEIGKDTFEISVSNKESSITSNITKWQLSEDGFEISFRIQITDFKTSNENLKIISNQVVNTELYGSIVTDKNSNLYLAVESLNGYFPPVQRSIIQSIQGRVFTYMQDGDRVCICCNNGGTGCTVRQCNHGSPCGVDQTLGAFCKWVSRTAAGNRDLVLVISICISILSGYRLIRWN